MGLVDGEWATPRCHVSRSRKMEKPPPKSRKGRLSGSGKGSCRVGHRIDTRNPARPHHLASREYEIDADALRNEPMGGIGAQRGKGQFADLAPGQNARITGMPSAPFAPK